MLTGGGQMLAGHLYCAAFFSADSLFVLAWEFSIRSAEVTASGSPGKYRLAELKLTDYSAWSGAGHL